MEELEVTQTQSMDKDIAADSKTADIGDYDGTPVVPTDASIDGQPDETASEQNDDTASDSMPDETASEQSNDTASDSVPDETASEQSNDTASDSVPDETASEQNDDTASDSVPDETAKDDDNSDGDNHQDELAKEQDDDTASDHLEILESVEPTESAPIRKLSEEELAQLTAEIDALEQQAELDKSSDKAPVTPKLLVVDNIDDSPELADEVGISNIFDRYGREILEPVFENRLRMSKNGVKLAYSKLKNTILSYKGVKQRYVDATETFKAGDKLLFVLEIGEDSVLCYFNIDANALDKEKFGHDKSEKHKDASTKLIIKREKDRKKTSSLERALELIPQVMDEHKLAMYKVYVPIAYAQRYPLNPNAVLRGNEDREPDTEAYKSADYDPIEGEITMNIIEELMPHDHSIEDKKGRARLDAMRQQAKTIKAAVAMTEPVVYFYDNAVNSDSTHAYMNVQQVLNDKFMGKVLPQQYFAVAESSDRIVDLNMLTLQKVVEDCNQYPKMLFATKVSARLLAKKTTLERLLRTAKTQHHNLILAFDAALLEALGEVGLAGVNTLKQHDIKIMIDGTENAGLKILTEYPIAYLRFDARYYDENIKSTVAHLDMLTGYCKVQGITTTAEYVDNTKVARFLQTHGVDLIQGPVVCEPKRTIYNAVKGIKRLPTFRK